MKKQGLYQGPTPTAVRLIPSINISIESVALDADTFMVIPCHVMQGEISRRTDVAGFKFSIADRQILNDSNNPRSLKSNPSSSMFSGEVVDVFRTTAHNNDGR